VTQDDLFQTATSSQQDTHASHLVRPGSDEARKMTVTSGRKYLTLCKQSGRLGAFSRMFLDTSVWASTKCYLTWKVKATPSNHLLFQLAPSMPRTDETESGLWATPTAAISQGTTRPSSKGGGSRDLRQDVRMWPTPDVRGFTNQGALEMLSQKLNSNQEFNGMTHRAGRKKKSKMWPTPTANEDAAGTPRGKMQAMLGNHPDVRGTTPEEWAQGSLNPAWVEHYLMGYPRGWTNLETSQE